MSKIIKGYYDNYTIEMDGILIRYTNLKGEGKTVTVPIYYWDEWKHDLQNRAGNYFELKIGN